MSAPRSNHDPSSHPSVPVMTDSLNAEGIPPDVIPRHPKMWALAKAAAEEAPRILPVKAA